MYCDSHSTEVYYSGGGVEPERALQAYLPSIIARTCTILYLASKPRPVGESDMEIVDAHMHLWTPETHPWLLGVKDGGHPAGKFGAYQGVS